MKYSQRIQELPPDERPYEKCLHSGPEKLTDSELLAVVLRSGTRGSSSVQLADEVLHLGQNEQGLLGIYHLSMEDLMQIRGIGQVKAVQIKCIGELSKRIATREAGKLLDFHSPDTIAAYYMERMRHEEQEQMICTMLNTKNQFLGDEVISRGTVNSSLVSPRDLILAAFRHRAVYMILVHNHPSGICLPSARDDSATAQIALICKLSGIELYDHVIVGDGDAYSYSYSGRLNEIKNDFEGYSR